MSKKVTDSIMIYVKVLELQKVNYRRLVKGDPRKDLSEYFQYYRFHCRHIVRQKCNTTTNRGPRTYRLINPVTLQSTTLQG